MVQLGARIAAARERSGFTQEQLAEQIGRSVSAVSRWERGKQELDCIDLLAIARVLQVPAKDIIEAPAEVQVVRSAALFFLSPERIERLRLAKSRDQLADLLNLGPAIGVVIEPQDIQVTEQQFNTAVREAAEIYNQKTAGAFSKLFARFRKAP